MSDTSFLIKAGLAFLVASAWVVVTAITGQRSAKWGGVVAALPSVTAFSLLFIAWTQGGWAASQTAGPLPAGLGAAAIATMAYVRLAGKRGVAASLVGSALAWGIAIFPLLLIKASRDPAPANGLGIFMILVSAVLLPPPPGTDDEVRGQVRGLLIKAPLSGATVAAAVVAAGILGPLAGTVVASFPIILWTSLMVFHTDLGAGALAAMARGFMVGLMGGMVFANASRFLFLNTGVLAAFLVSYAACLATVTLIVLLGGHRDQRWS
ncbi:MAG: hypothetical protein HZB91_12875 [Elusimicrobia bacterium]|nr:hypothetical protein [Elusimicrobiota bacterium]